MLNVLIVGNGQCGNRILDAINKQAMTRGSNVKEASGGLSKYFSKHQYQSNVQTVAINTAINDLKEMKFTKAKDRVHIKNLHGVGANRTIGKEVFDQQKGNIIKNIEERGNFDVAFVITSASGGTGSSFTPPLIAEMKKAHDFPIYAVVILPFREEGTLYLQNAAFMLKELRDGPCDGIILADNQYLKSIGGNVQEAYDGINSMIARRLLFLLDSLDSEMMMVTDLGDFKTVMTGGAGLATVGYYKAESEMPIRTVIQNCLSPRGLLFSTDVYKEGGRAMVILKGDKKYLTMNEITTEIEKLSGAIGHVFKGVIVENGSLPEALCVLTLNAAEELESLYEGAIQAIGMEKDKKDRVKKKKEMESAFVTIDGMDPEY